MTGLRVICALAVAAVLASSCSSGSGGSTSGSGNSKSEPFVLAFSDTPGLADLPLYMAISSMKKAGYNISAKVLAGPSIMIAALATNQVQLGAGDTIVTANAYLKSKDLTTVLGRVNNVWAMVAQKKYANCSTWGGKPVGIFAKGTITFVYELSYIKQHCPNVTPNWVTVPDASLRVKALAANEIIATTLDDTTAPEILATDHNVTLLANLDTLGYGRETVESNTTDTKQRANTLQAFIKDDILAVRQLYAHPANVVSLAKTYLPVSLGSTASADARWILSRKGWCANGGMTDSNMKETVAAGERYGIVPKGFNAANITDSVPVIQVLKQIGKSSITAC